MMLHKLGLKLAGTVVIVAPVLLAFTPAGGARQGDVSNQQWPQEADERPVVVNSDLVTLTVTITDGAGRYVTGLDRSAFTLTDNKVRQEVSFFSDADEPASVGVVFDLSGSMSGEKVARAREALARFTETGHPEDEYFLVGCSSDARLLLDRTRDSDALPDKLFLAETKGLTALYDAAYLGLTRVSRGAHPRRALLIISDGQDNHSRYSFRELSRLAKESDVLIYAVGIEGPSPGTELDFYGKMLLAELAGDTGGRAFFPHNGDELQAALDAIAVELRRQYSISYRPSNFTADGKWHRVRVRVTPPPGVKRLYVRAKEGYYAGLNQRR